MTDCGSWSCPSDRCSLRASLLLVGSRDWPCPTSHGWKSVRALIPSGMVLPTFQVVVAIPPAWVPEWGVWRKAPKLLQSACSKNEKEICYYESETTPLGQRAVQHLALAMKCSSQMMPR